MPEAATTRQRPSPAEIAGLRHTVAQLDKELAEARGRLRDALIAVAPYVAGDQVELNWWSRTEGKRIWSPAIVRSVAPSYGDSYRVFVSLKKKNGEWMDREQQVWSVNEIRKAQ